MSDRVLLCKGMSRFLSLGLIYQEAIVRIETKKKTGLKKIKSRITWYRNINLP